MVHCGFGSVWTGAHIRNLYGGSYVVTSRYLLYSTPWALEPAVYWNWSRLSGCGFWITTVHLSEKRSERRL
jgi:hypothetical protein